MLVCDGSGGLSQSEGQEEYCGNPRPNRTRPLSDKRVLLPKSCRRAPQQVSAARLLAGYDPAKPARRNVLGPELRCSLQDGTAAVSGRGHSAAPGFAAWVAEKGVHHESRACPSQQTVQTAAYGANRRHHPGKIASSGMVYNPFNKE